MYSGINITEFKEPVMGLVKVVKYKGFFINIIIFLMELVHFRKEEIQRQIKEEQTLRNVFNKDIQTQVDKITSLEHELTQERQTRHLMEQEMSSEIRRLQEDLARLQAQQGQEHLAPSRHTHSGIPSPAKSTSLPPTPVSGIAVPPLSQKDEVKNILKNLLNQATDGVNHCKFVEALVFDKYSSKIKL